MVNCIFSDITERDMDLLFMEEFICSSDFLDLFLKRTAFTGARVVKVEQSKTHPQWGESDITVIVEKDGQYHGLLVEDKIDAIEQPQQAYRYVQRGNIGIEEGNYISFSTFIIAPQKYLDVNAEAERYQYQISYEECLAVFEGKNDSRSIFKKAQIIQAIDKQKKGYQAVADNRVTAFWKLYAEQYCGKYGNFPELIDNVKERPASSVWVYYRTGSPKIHIIHKAMDKRRGVGFVDIQFEGLVERKRELEILCQQTFGNLYDIGLQVESAGQSVVIRAQVPAVDFSDNFEKQKREVETALQKVVYLRKMLDDLPKEQLNRWING